MKKALNPLLATILSIFGSTTIYLIVAYFAELKDFAVGFTISIVIPAVVAYPISFVFAKFYKKMNAQKIEIEQSNKKIHQSINYASRIQQALLPEEKLFSENFSSHFILNRPRDVVSGDFYFLKIEKKHSIIAVADCTGHGVPGAFVSMLGISYLNEIINENKIKNAAQILDELRKKVKISLKQTDKNSTNQDGMDIALCVINTETNNLSFSGANNPLYFFRNNNLTEIKATRNPIGIYPKEIPFKNTNIQLQKQDRIYLFTDGYPDQIGGEQGTKFKKNNFRNLLISTQTNLLFEQKKILTDTLKKWQSNKYKQIDDILILGIEI